VNNGSYFQTDIKLPAGKGKTFACMKAPSHFTIKKFNRQPPGVSETADEKGTFISHLAALTSNLLLFDEDRKREISFTLWRKRSKEELFKIIAAI
jgi:hypothetical protein